jgi:hypothetical protein
MLSVCRSFCVWPANNFETFGRLLWNLARKYFHWRWYRQHILRSRSVNHSKRRTFKHLRWCKTWTNQRGTMKSCMLLGLQSRNKLLLKFRVFWDVLPCSQVDVNRRFRGAYCLHHQRDEYLLRPVLWKNQKYEPGGRLKVSIFMETTHKPLLDKCSWYSKTSCTYLQLIFESLCYLTKLLNMAMVWNFELMLRQTLNHSV